MKTALFSALISINVFVLGGILALHWTTPQQQQLGGVASIGEKQLVASSTAFTIGNNGQTMVLATTSDRYRVAFGPINCSTNATALVLPRESLSATKGWPIVGSTTLQVENAQVGAWFASTTVGTCTLTVTEWRLNRTP